MDVYGRTPDQIKRSLDDIGCCTQCELYGYTHDKYYGCPDNEKNICAKDDALRLIEKYEEVIESRSHEPTREQLANLFSYMHRLSQLISPADAKKILRILIRRRNQRYVLWSRCYVRKGWEV